MTVMMSTDEWIERAIAVHGSKYDYSETVYSGQSNKVKIWCKEHKEFFDQPAGGHLSGKGCQKCGINASRQSKVDTADEFIAKAKLVHGNWYSYAEVVYVNAHIKVQIICPTHGSFEQKPNNHLNGKGCFSCGRQKTTQKQSYTLEEFIGAAIAIHGDKYDYSKVEYVNNKTDVLIICKVHEQEFWQRPSHHLDNHGCPRCFHTSSRVENQWLDSIGKNLDRQKIIRAAGRSLKVDGYDPETNTAYEFWGDFWHGNPKIYDPHDFNIVSKKTFGQLYEETLLKIEQLKTVCTNVITIWEDDWYEAQGISSKKVRRRKR